MSIYMQLKYKTKITNKETLKKVFEELNVRYKELNDELVCNIDFYELHFKKGKAEEYEINTKGYNDFKEDIIDFREKITDCYNKLIQNNLQEEICKNIKTKVAKKSSMSLVQEETLEDNSIVLTISI